MAKLNKDNWCASQWQAFISRLPTFEQRRQAVENEVPEPMRERVISHLRTVMAIKNKAGA